MMHHHMSKCAFWVTGKPNRTYSLATVAISDRRQRNGQEGGWMDKPRNGGRDETHGPMGAQRDREKERREDEANEGGTESEGG
ncbi:unnamed protein product [Enterobius vermicularis]|uniref:Uncharacterized protein n=1 Tax=Enterobius vermicularis TaxID=51028 RepID=A0A0N4V893_ENTVE|nr:unnamed protein product [Enterobius vermicularis]